MLNLIRGNRAWPERGHSTCRAQLRLAMAGLSFLLLQAAMPAWAQQPAPGRAQLSAADPVTLQALSAEVGRLRNSLETGAALAALTQIALQRVSTHQQRMLMLRTRESELRQEIELAVAEREGTIAAQLANEAQRSAAKGRMRQVLDQSAKNYGVGAERAAQAEQQIRSRLAETLRAIQAEDAKLDQAEVQLAELERKLRQAARLEQPGP